MIEHGVLTVPESPLTELLKDARFVDAGPRQPVKGRHAELRSRFVDPMYGGSRDRGHVM
jgi:hypothetical protein